MDEVAKIREKIDLVSLIQEYIPLKKAGRNFKANCPFHGEKTPSFVISPERQIWHCFGCAKGGDAYTFLMEYDHMEFPEALRMLAKKAGIEITQTPLEAGVSSKKEKIYVLNHLASEFYQYILNKHVVGGKALQYLIEKRGVKLQTLHTYQLGFAPFQQDALVSYLLKKKKYTTADLLEAGLATTRNGRIVDFFQGRIIFPLFDHRGNVIGFAGRILEDNASSSKYINTRETLVYHKGNVFFGLNSAKEAIKKEQKAIIMEGELDVIAAFQEGITNVVAVKGTALTEEQARLIARFAEKVTLCFDMDKAGQEATKRSLPVLENNGLAVTVISIPHGKDADEALKTDVIAFKKAIKHDSNIYEYFMEKSLSAFDGKTIEGKKQITDELLPLLMHIKNEVIKEHLLQKLSKSLDTSYETLIKEMERIEKKEVVKKQIIFEKKKRARRDILEEYFVALLVQSAKPQDLLPIIPEKLSTYVFHVTSLQKIIEYLGLFIQQQTSYDAKTFLANLPQELVTAFDTCFLLPLPKFIDEEKYKEEVQKTLDELHSLFVHEEIKKISTLLKEKEQALSPDEVSSLQEKLSHLTSLISS